jgi:hypothetical protein
MRTRKPVQINFMQVLAIASIGTFSLNAFGDHHGDQKASKAATMSKLIEERETALVKPNKNQAPMNLRLKWMMKKTGPK